jgi:hypothetical protein
MNPIKAFPASSPNNHSTSLGLIEHHSPRAGITQMQSKDRIALRYLTDSVRKPTTAADGAKQREDHQRPQAELKPTASTLRRFSFGRLGLHGRITVQCRQPEQGCSAPEPFSYAGCYTAGMDATSPSRRFQFRK